LLLWIPASAGKTTIVIPAAETAIVIPAAETTIRHPAGRRDCSSFPASAAKM